ncbi:uncharacterized protein LOC129587371 isoform X2 [Paramacrobiotus metropolitanus]|uniref:uncharacterized protein LOC129587371 isoform X2 n=1 Tax=Paramacrobiotus metropolitanus TaxID=2943436 RepID=UPI00244598E1|nr:uncharacterized protein LOC129587371 isoform X2 [Paramacrobiotus metropolitanus]
MAENAVIQTFKVDPEKAKTLWPPKGIERHQLITSEDAIRRLDLPKELKIYLLGDKVECDVHPAGGGSARVQVPFVKGGEKEAELLAHVATCRK